VGELVTLPDSVTEAELPREAADADLLPVRGIPVVNVPDYAEETIGVTRC
jgi:hypothetical protein